MEIAKITEDCRRLPKIAKYQTKIAKSKYLSGRLRLVLLVLLFMLQTKVTSIISVWHYNALPKGGNSIQGISDGTHIRTDLLVGRSPNLYHIYVSCT